MIFKIIYVCTFYLEKYSYLFYMGLSTYQIHEFVYVGVHKDVHCMGYIKQWSSVAVIVCEEMS